MQNADSVILISHKLTKEYSPKIVYDKPNNYKQRFFYSYLSRRNINPRIILKRFRLNKTGVSNITEILEQPVDLKPLQQVMCDEPHNSILIYKNKQLSYLDICFTSLRIHPSKDLRFSESDMDSKKWNDLQKFFKKQKVYNGDL